MEDEKDKIIENLLSALKDASQHLDYCGYGDAWERDCARSEGLPAKIEIAIDEAETFIKKKKKRVKDTTR